MTDPVLTKLDALLVEASGGGAEPLRPELVASNLRAAEAQDELLHLARTHLRPLVAALAQAASEQRASTDQRTCIEQVHGDNHAYCGTCSLCLRKKALTTLKAALDEIEKEAE